MIQSVDVLVKAQSRRSCCAFGAFARICLSPCVVLRFLLYVPHALTIHIDSSVPSRLKSDQSSFSLSIHAVASLTKSLTSQYLEILEHIAIESTRKEIAHGRGAVIQ